MRRYDRNEESNGIYEPKDKTLKKETKSKVIREMTVSQNWFTIEVVITGVKPNGKEKKAKDMLRGKINK